MKLGREALTALIIIVFMSLYVLVGLVCLEISLDNPTPSERIMTHFGT